MEISFFKKVYEVVRKIPYGRVTTYGTIARHIGSPMASRMVGWALNNAHNLSDIPAHRVVNRQGLLTGKHHFETPFLMQELLKNEGAVIKDNKIQNFKELLWVPEVS